MKALLVGIILLCLVGSAMALEATRTTAVADRVLVRPHVVAPEVSHASVSVNDGGGRSSGISYCELQTLLAKMDTPLRKENLLKSWQARNPNRVNKPIVCEAHKPYRIGFGA